MPRFNSCLIAFVVFRNSISASGEKGIPRQFIRCAHVCNLFKKIHDKVEGKQTELDGGEGFELDYWIDKRVAFEFEAGINKNSRRVKGMGTGNKRNEIIYYLIFFPDKDFDGRFKPGLFMPTVPVNILK